MPDKIKILVTLGPSSMSEPIVRQFIIGDDISIDFDNVRLQITGQTETWDADASLAATLNA